LQAEPRRTGSGPGHGYGSFAPSAIADVAYLVEENGMLVDRLPPVEALDDLMYKSVAVGFAFFTVTTILGAPRPAQA
jgi:ABC-type transport system involved in cytochrome c biogenesis permease subunit